MLKNNYKMKQKYNYLAKNLENPEHLHFKEYQR